jgi:hypothetical protein
VLEPKIGACVACATCARSAHAAARVHGAVVRAWMRRVRRCHWATHAARHTRRTRRSRDTRRTRHTPSHVSKRRLLQAARGHAGLCQPVPVHHDGAQPVLHHAAQPRRRCGVGVLVCACLCLHWGHAPCAHARPTHTAPRILSALHALAQARDTRDTRATCATHATRATHATHAPCPRTAARLPPEAYERSPSGDCFVKASLSKGILPEILEELLATRKR